jgi:hypothetical protein
MGKPDRLGGHARHPGALVRNVLELAVVTAGISLYARSSSGEDVFQ